MVNNIDFLINTKEDTIDIFKIDTISSNDIKDALDDDKRIQDKFMDTLNKASTVKRDTILDNKIEQAVLDFKNTKADKYFNIIYKQYNKVLYNWSQRSANNIIEQEELYSMAMETLLNTVNIWDPSKNTKLNTLLWANIKNAMTVRNKRKHAIKRKTDMLCTSINSTHATYKNESELTLESTIKGEEDVVDKDWELKMAIDKLDIKQRDKDAMKLLVDGYNGMEIAEMLNVTPACITMSLRRLGKSNVGKTIKKILLEQVC